MLFVTEVLACNGFRYGIAPAYQGGCNTCGGPYAVRVSTCAIRLPKAAFSEGTDG